MAYINAQSPIRYQIDNLDVSLSGVLVTKPENPVDLTAASAVRGITITGTQPKGTDRRFAFQLNNQWGKLTVTGAFSAFALNNPSYSNIAANGNTASEIAALTDLPILAGRTFGFAIALYAEDPTVSVPTARVEFNCIARTYQLEYSQLSPVYELGSDTRIISVTADTLIANGGRVSVTAQAKNSDGTLSGWKPLDYFEGMTAQNIQFSAEYSAETPGTSSAEVRDAYILTAKSSELTAGLVDGAVFTKTLNWYMPIHHCRLTINHAPLENSVLKAYVAFRNQPSDVKREILGTGSGFLRVFQLAHNKGVDYNSFRLYYDNIQVYSGFELDCETARVSCEAPSGVIVSCDYSYGWDKEQWQEMSLYSRIGLDTYDQSEYRYTSSENSKTAAAIKITLNLTSGRISNETLGTASGSAKSFKLSKRVLNGRISLTANGASLSASNWKLLDNPQYVSVTAASGAVIRASYDWVSEPPVVAQFMAVFSE